MTIFLTIENTNLNVQCDLSIKSDRGGQHSQFLRCLDMVFIIYLFLVGTGYIYISNVLHYVNCTSMFEVKIH